MKTLYIKEKAKELGLTYHCLWQRLYNGKMTEEEALTKPYRKCARHTDYKGKPIMQALEENGITYACYYKRLKMGWSRKQAIETPMRKLSWKNRLKGKQNV